MLSSIRKEVRSSVGKIFDVFNCELQKFEGDVQNMLVKSTRTFRICGTLMEISIFEESEVLDLNSILRGRIL